LANYVKFKQGLKKDFNTTNQPLTNGMIYFVIDENNNGSIYYDTIVDGKQATKNGAVHRVKFSGLPIKITGSVTGTGVISQDGETIEINTSTNHSHGLAHQDFTVTLSNDDTNLKWTRLGNQNGEGFWLKSIKGNVKAPAWFQPNYGTGIAFGGGSTKGIISVKYNEPSIRFAGGNGDAPVWYFTITGSNDKSYDLNRIGGHSSDSAKLDHNITFKIASTADATNGANGTKTDLSGPAVNLYLPTKISGFDLLQASRFQGNADSATYATSAGYAKGLFLNPETRQEDMNFNLADAKYIKKVTYSMATSTTKKNKPPIGDANILSFGWDNSGYGSQLAIQNSGAGHLAVRGSGSTNGASSWGEWSTVLDSSNYTSYINNYYWANVKVSTASSTETKPTFNTAYTSNWWRSTGKTGWWNDTYSGGIAMEDKTYVKVAGNKSFFIPNGSLKIGGNGDIFFATGYDDATLKIYGQTNTDFGAETIVIQTCFDNRDPQTSEYTTQYANRCNLLLQPRGGQVYIGKNLTTPGDVGYKLLVGGNQWIEGNLVFKGAKEIKFIGSKQTYSMIRFIDNTSDNYGNGISIGGGGSTVIGAGESAMSYVTNGGDERLFLLSDGAINIEAGGDTISNRKGLQVTSDGHILPIKAENSNPNAQDLGSAADYWRNLYINNITLQSQVGNRLVWTNGSKILQAGYHYADTDRIAINTAGRQGYNFYVNGSSYFSSNTYIHRNYFLNNPSTGAGELILTALGYKSAGYPVYNDPEFASGSNSISVYNNAANGTVTHAIVSDASSGNSSGKVLKITHTGSGSPGFGGFVQYISSRANAIFIQIFRAKIPTGRNVATASNSMGDNYKDEWLTPTTGTGRWEWYARRVICGASGTFSTGGHVYIKDGVAPTASSPLVWYLSYCNVIDVTKGNYDGLRTRYSDFVIYDSGENGKDNKTPINDKYVAKIVTKTSNGTTFTLRGLNGAGNELADAVLTIPNAGSGKAGLITDAAQTIYGEKTLTSNLRFANVTTGTRGIVGTIADNDYWRVVGCADKTNEGYLEIATGDDANEPIYMRQYSGVFKTVKRTFTILDGSGRSRAPELFEAKKVHVNSKLNQSTAIADISYQFQVTGTSNFTDTVNISGVTNHHNNIQIDANYSIARPGKNSAWYGSHNNAMIRMTSVNDWSPLLAQKATNGYWILGHYNYHNEKDENDKNSDFRDQWLFGYLANSNLEGTTGASNSLTTTYRLLNIGGNDNQRMFVSAKYNAVVGSETQPVYVQSNGNVATCSYSLSATIEAGTANRMAYYKAANQIGSSGHYVTSSQVGINSNTTHDFTFYVGGNSYFSNLVTVYAGNNLGVKIGNTNITAIDGSLIFQNNTALRFGSSEWDWNKWAGLKYIPDSKTIVMGLADSTNFVANAVQSGGTFLFTGMSSIDLNKTASIKNLAIGGGIYWNPYVESAGDGSDAASITVIAHGAADGTELRIQQQNDANDIINLVVNNSIFLNGKRAFRPYDGWLRINEDSSFGYGIYTGSSLVRSDNQLQVGDSGNKFYANSAGDGYFSNALGIAGTNTNYRLYVDGKTWLRDALYIGSDTNGKNKNYIAFYGTYGDGEGYFNHTYIGENVFSTSGESSELVLFKGNDQGSNDTVESITGSGPDRIRHIAAGHLFQVYRTAMSGSFSDVCASTAPSTVLEVNGGGLSIHGQKITFTTTNSSGSSINSIGSVVRIYGNTYGNDANYLISKTAGVFSYGDGGPQIRFGTNYAGNQQEGALIYTDHNSAGAGVSWHFVSNQSDWSVNSKRYVARTSVTIGSLLPNTSYALYVGGGESYYTNHINMQQNASILFPQVNQFLRWTSSTSNNNSTGRTWYGIGTYQAGDSYNWLNISNYWGINITTKDDTHLQHNGKVLTNSGNATGTVGSSTKPVYSNQGVLTPITSYEGNAATATNATNAKNSDTVDNYHASSFFIQDRLEPTSTAGNDGLWGLTGNRSFHGALPEGLSNIYPYGQLISFSTNNAARFQIYAAHMGSVDSTLSYRTGWGTDKRVWRTFIDSGNIGKQSVNYAASAGNADTVDGYHAADLFSGGYKTTLDLSALNNNLYYPVTGASIPANGYHKIKVSVHLNSGTKPSWATHNSGFTTNVELYTTASGWGTTHGETIILNDSYNFTNCGQVVGFTQNGNTSTPVLWLRGGGKYFVECDYQASWTIRTSLYYTQGSSSDTYHQTVEPQSSYPGFKAGDGGAINGVIRAGQVYGAVWNDYAEYRKTKEYIQPGYCVIETGKGDLIKSSERLQPGANIVSDTFGFAIGETEQTKTPLAVSGRVLAYPYEDRDLYQAGDPVCSGPNGTISKMTREEVREYPERIIGTVSEIPNYEVWGTGNVKVNNRIWIKVK
jgi:hypothetical protein